MKAYVDGACSGNPGPGGWAVVFEDGREFSGHVDETTNNQMELEAVRQAIRYVQPEMYVTIFTDSVNVIGWLYGWNTVTSKPDPAKKFKIKNFGIGQQVFFIQELARAAGVHLSFQKVNGHSGDPLNERADTLASNACYLSAARV